MPAPPPVALPLSASWPPAVLPYRHGQPIPPGYRIEQKSQAGLIYGGLSMWAIPYAAGLVAAAGYGFPAGTGWLAVPIVGPFIAMGSRDIDCDLDRLQYDPSVELKDLEEKCLDSAIDEVTIVALLTISGILQISGGVMTTVGLGTSESQLVRTDLAGLSLRPRFGRSETTMTAELRF